MTIAYPPERTLMEFERADEAALRPRTLHALCQQAARLVQCPGCGQKPSRACSDAGGYCLARFAQARRRGLIAAEEMTAVLAAAGDVFTNTTIIRDGGR